MSDIDIANLRKLLAEATPGPLRYHSYSEGRKTDVEGERRMVLVWAAVDPTGRHVAKFNQEREVAAYVATSSAAPALLDELESLRREVERLRGVLRTTHEHHCVDDYTKRGMHAPECLLHEAE